MPRSPPLLLLLLLCALALLAAATASAASLTTNYVSMFEDFKARYGRRYASPADEAARLRVFIENMKRAERLSVQNPLATFGVNEYADESAAEFKARRHGADAHFAAALAKRAPIASVYDDDVVRAAAPVASIDWRAKGAVTYVKNQQQCGGCYSFSTTGNIEGQWFLAGNPLVALSEQEILSCDPTNSGCGGGTMDAAFEWLVSAQGGAIATEASYPFVSASGKNVPACALPKTTGATITGHVDLPQDEDQMAAWCAAKGPISIAVDATSFQTYTGGILTNCISQQLDHAILIVGFDDTNSPPYWIIKNSWGPSWGEDGYIRVEKGTNQCLLDSAPSTSVVGGSPSPASSSASGSSPASSSSSSSAAASSSSSSSSGGI